jgi:hypothetical protein
VSILLLVYICSVAIKAILLSAPASIKLYVLLIKELAKFNVIVLFNGVELLLILEII